MDVLHLSCLLQPVVIATIKTVKKHEDIDRSKMEILWIYVLN